MFFHIFKLWIFIFILWLKLVLAANLLFFVGLRNSHKVYRQNVIKLFRRVYGSHDTHVNVLYFFVKKKQFFSPLVCWRKKMVSFELQQEYFEQLFRHQLKIMVTHTSFAFSSVEKTSKRTNKWVKNELGSKTSSKSGCILWKRKRNKPQMLNFFRPDSIKIHFQR